jgi:EAL domain-containing protein (putative c-di-GMP-specific phosphodiesterase class I)
LRSALTTGGPWHPHLGVAYQPVIDLTTGRLTSFEALARLTDSQGAPISPDTFISVAEDTGLIAGLGEAVLNTAMEGLVRWRGTHTALPAATMAVNFSARQAQQVDMPALVREALTRHDLQPADLTLELTESVLLEAGSSTLHQLTELHTAGVAISIDDFGTGYASLHYLTTLPVSSLKVDKSFTSGLLQDPNSATIVRAVAALAAEMGLGCIIEGIETEHQLAALPPGTLGQGYLLGRPTAEPQDEWLRPPALRSADMSTP